MIPVRMIGQDDGVHAVDRIQSPHVRRETDEEAAERRRQDARDRERRRREMAAQRNEPTPAVAGEPAIVPAEAAPDGHPHCDIRV
jgi:hypothetical protein